MGSKIETPHGDTSLYPLFVAGVVLLGLGFQKNVVAAMSAEEWAYLKARILLGLVALATCGLGIYLGFFSKAAKRLREQRKLLSAVPESLRVASQTSAYLGHDLDMDAPIYLPNGVRSRHVHILGATGSGKTESVVLNLLKQDIEHGHPIVILDAKGDKSFLDFLQATAMNRLKVFDLSTAASPCTYDPLGSGSWMEAAQRLFNSLVWSEPYYRSKARSVLFRIFEALARRQKPFTFCDIANALESAKTLNGIISPTDGSTPKLSDREFEELAGLRDQIQQIATGHFPEILEKSPGKEAINLADDIKAKRVVYFRLQALLDADSAALLGRLIINDLAFTAAQKHLSGESAEFCPVFLDEFGSFVCPAFLELIAKARSAGLALHFSHQSISDLESDATGFLGRVMDNASTKIVLRTYDPDSTDRMGKAFGLKRQTKLTQSVEGELDDFEKTGAGSARDVEVFRAPPAIMKFLPTGQGFAFIAHGIDAVGEGSAVFRLRFPRLEFNQSTDSQKENVPNENHQPTAASINH
ncbi:MAG: type IV secretion system DNA-binding domain-containing protein [Bdellovibrionales bacterium]|nr:type IV secretion system DNA-binding domain-containing protein [Bdellovibrionales bacterium]